MIHLDLVREAGRIQHLFSAGPVAMICVRLEDGQFVDVVISRKELDEQGLSVGHEVEIHCESWKQSLSDT